MPAKSAKQRRFMNAVGHDPAFAAKVGVSQSVGREFAETPIQTPGGAVRSGGYFDNTKFKTPSMPPMRKVKT